MCEKKLSLSQFAADKGKDKEEGEDEEAEAVVTSGKCEAALRHLGSTDSAQTVLFDWRPNFVCFFFFFSLIGMFVPRASTCSRGVPRLCTSATVTGVSLFLRGRSRKTDSDRWSSEGSEILSGSCRGVCVCM